jgi:hypothetical protein
MSYGRWQPLAHALAPDGPGLMQVRAGEGAAGLHDYPTGKSAMVYYGADDTRLAEALDAFRRRIPAALGEPLWVRFAPASTGRAPSESLAEALRQFAARFGAPPRLNQ